MDHAQIEEQQLAERYVKGTLLPEEAERFEEHYLSCQECLDRLELAESMDRGFKRAAREEVTRIAAVRSLAGFAWLARLGRWRQSAALLAVVAISAALPGLVAWRQAKELGAVRGSLAEARRGEEAERERAAASSRTEGEASALRTALAREREAKAEAERQLQQARQPQGNVPLLFLAVERGAGEPTHRLRLPAAPGWAVLSLEIEPPHHAPYTATLRDRAGREVWRGQGLKPNEMDSLSLSLPTTLLAPGDYTIEVAASGAPASRFAFRVLPSA